MPASLQLAMTSASQRHNRQLFAELLSDPPSFESSCEPVREEDTVAETEDYGPSYAAIALASYSPQEEVDDNENVLSIKTGDVLETWPDETSGWWWARDQNGNDGYVPSTFIQVLNEEDELVAGMDRGHLLNSRSNVAIATPICDTDIPVIPAQIVSVPLITREPTAPPFEDLQETTPVQTSLRIAIPPPAPPRDALEPLHGKNGSKKLTPTVALNIVSRGVRHLLNKRSTSRSPPGSPLEEEVHALRARNTALESEHARLRRQLHDVSKRKFQQKVARDAEYAQRPPDVREPRKCSLCRRNDRATTISPCGHSFCTTCERRVLQMHACALPPPPTPDQHGKTELAAMAKCPLCAEDVESILHMC